LTVQRRGCSACGRKIYAQGSARIVEAAQTLNGDEPAEDYLAKLETSRRPAALRRLADIAIVLNEYAREGQLRIPLELNQLQDDLWEIKVGDTRLPFYEFQDSVHGSMVTRLTHGFKKGQWPTPKGEIRRGMWIVGQDRQI
jgi:hypothetical protein